MFFLNFHIKSRKIEDIKRRCTTLTNLIVKEIETNETTSSKKVKNKNDGKISNQ